MASSTLEDAPTAPDTEYEPTSPNDILDSLAPHIQRFKNIYRYTLEDMKGAERQFLFYENLQQLKQELTESDAGRTVANKLHEIFENRPDLQIVDAVCLGLGQFTKYTEWDLDAMAASGGDEDEDEEMGGLNYDKALMGQLAAFCCWLDVLSE